jgi:3-hydroxyacyl-CoA dehydrogenase/enoyl-CoA hydratase/3-hydroxybutyryl-CoA epimerase
VAVTGNAKPNSLPPKSEDFRDDGLDLITRRLVYPMLAEAVRCLEEGVVSQPWAIDLGMVLGTGFAPHRGGPLHMIDAIGAENVVANMQRLQYYHGDRFANPRRLVNVAASGARFIKAVEPSSVALSS